MRSCVSETAAPAVHHALSLRRASRVSALKGGTRATPSAGNAHPKPIQSPAVSHPKLCWMGLDGLEKPIRPHPKTDEETSNAHPTPVWMGILQAVKMDGGGGHPAPKVRGHRMWRALSARQRSAVAAAAAEPHCAAPAEPTAVDQESCAGSAFMCSTGNGGGGGPGQRAVRQAPFEAAGEVVREAANHPRVRRIALQRSARRATPCQGAAAAPPPVCAPPPR